MWHGSIFKNRKYLKLPRYCRCVLNKIDFGESANQFSLRRKGVSMSTLKYWRVSTEAWSSKQTLKYWRVSTEAWSSKQRNQTGFSAESKEESEVIKIWALDIPRMLGISGLKCAMPAETRRRVRGKVSPEHEGLESCLHIREGLACSQVDHKLHRTLTWLSWHASDQIGVLKTTWINEFNDLNVPVTLENSQVAMHTGPRARLDSFRCTYNSCEGSSGTAIKVVT